MNNSINSIENSKIDKWNQGLFDEETSKPICLHHLFENTVTNYPENISVIFDDKKLNYSELNKRSNQLAHCLKSEQIEAGNYVGILLNRSPEMYIAMLAILKAGAAYVPIDPSFPADRINYILSDCNAKFLLTNSDLDQVIIENTCAKICIDKIEEKLQILNPKNLNIQESKVSPENIAYVIYTSGTTGNPKGVKISHQSISNLVRTERKIFNVNQTDIIFQGFSIAFDASLEEIWLAFNSGAALFIGTDAVMLSGPDFSRILTENKVTVFSTVPTFLAMLNNDIPTLKLLILGGETCPQELVNLWWRQNRRMLNTYGPTEATVISSYTECSPDKKVSIGNAIPNCSIYILDSNLEKVLIGIPGELCIGGLNLSEGYINNEELNVEKFIVPKFEINPAFPKRFYRTGDLARFNENGEIEFLGRIDSQVKLRGFRIELQEIESQLRLCSGVKNAAVTIKEGFNKIQNLVAYIIPTDKSILNLDEIRKQLREKLAAYMIPTIYEIVDSFPILASGKIDRSKLPDPIIYIEATKQNDTSSLTKTEKNIFTVWEKIFSPLPVSISDDFFDLGGHSLLASQMISELRKNTDMENLSVKNIYIHKTIKELAIYADTINDSNENKKSKNNQYPIQKTKKVSEPIYYTTVILQSISILLFFGIAAFTLMLPIIFKHFLPSANEIELAFISIFGILLMYPLYILLSIIIKWTVIGKFEKGKYPLWGFYYFRFWFVKKWIDLVPLSLMSGTPFLALYLRLMGAKIGKNVYLGSDRIRIFDLISIDDDSSISKESQLMGYSVENGILNIGSVSVGKACFIGARSVLNENTIMEDNSAILELSMLPENEKIPANQSWRGSPAKKQENLFSFSSSKKPIDSTNFFFRTGLSFIYLLSVTLVILIPLALMAPYAEALYLSEKYWGLLPSIFATIPLSALYVIFFCLTSAFLKWMILGKLKECDIRVHSILYIRKWIVDSLFNVSLMSFRALFGTIYLPSWLRLMGADIGKRTEISTVNHLSTDLLKVSNESFLADSISIGAPLVHKGIMRIKTTEIGTRSFIGNSAVIPTGGKVEDECLIGVLSSIPENNNHKKLNNTSWLGSPPMFLPKRQESPDFKEKFTFKPSANLYLLRGCIEFFKITVPYAIAVSLLLIFYYTVFEIYKTSGLTLTMIWSLPFTIAIIAITPLFAIFSKWVLIGKYKPLNKPLWSTFVWRNEFVNSIAENLVYPFTNNAFLGTPFASFFFKAMGCKMGKRIFMETNEITEFDLVEIGNNTSLNFGCTIQTHLFEDRVMKMSYVKIADNCSIGAMSVVLYDSVMEEKSKISSLSLLMKGETLRANTSWHGSPVKSKSDNNEPSCC